MHMFSRLLLLVAAVLLTVAFTGCASPFDFSRSDELRNTLISDYQKQLKSDDATADVTTHRTPSDVEENLTPERRKQLDSMSGYAAYADDKVSYGPGLTVEQDQPHEEVAQVLRPRGYAAEGSVNPPPG